MNDALGLLRLHVEALFTRNSAGRLLRVNDPSAAPAPRFFLGRTPQGEAWWFRDDVSPALVEDLNELCSGDRSGFQPEAAIDDRLFVERLTRDAPVHKVWSGPAFAFPTTLPTHADVVRVTSRNASILSPYLADWIPDVSVGVPMTAVLEDGEAVSVCCSVRVTPRAHEAGVETHASFRRRGHAHKVVAGWAAIVSDMHRVPLYSTSWSNEASRAVARKLGLIQFASDLHVT